LALSQRFIVEGDIGIRCISYHRRTDLSYSSLTEHRQHGKNRLFLPKKRLFKGFFNAFGRQWRVTIDFILGSNFISNDKNINFFVQIFLNIFHRISLIFL